MYARHILLILCLCTVGWLPGQVASSIDSQAKWLWYPENFSQATTHVDRYARVVFTCSADHPDAYLFMHTDDNGEAWLNGESAPRSTSPAAPAAKNLGHLLRKGRNVLAVRVHNGRGPGGLIAHLQLSSHNGFAQSVVSDTHWKISRTPADGWTTLQFNDSSWATPKILGNTLSAPWGNLYDFRFIYTPAERKQYDDEQDQVKQAIRDLQDRLQAAPPLHAEIDIRPDTNPKIILNGRAYNAFLYDSPYPWPYSSPKTIEKIQNFHAGDLNLYVLGVDAVHFWKAHDTIDYSLFDQRIQNALLLNPDAYLMVAINFTSAPDWWIAAHPQDLIDYANGGIDRKASDPIQRVAQPSLASELWKHDFCETVAKAVRHIEKQPYGKRVFAYRIDCGVYREWHYFGMADGLPDCSPCMQNQFRQYLQHKYKTDAALQKAWHRQDVTLKSAAIPTKDERLQSIADGKVLRDPLQSLPTVDFLHAMQGCIRDFIIAVNTAAKDASGWHKLCGNYSGYFFGMVYPAEGWHLENENVLASKAVDFQSCPNLYAHRKITDAEYGRSLVESTILKGKLNIQEHDTRTALTVDDPGHTHVKDLDESIDALSRDFAQSLTRNSGFWYLDFSKDWYNHPRIFAMFKRFQPILNHVQKNPSVAEVALVGDLENVYYHRVAHIGKCLTIDCNVQALTHTGVPFDTILVDDLAHPAVRDYKVYIFPNLFYVTAERLAIIDKLTQAGKTIVWLYAPGYLNRRGHGTDTLEIVSGFRVRENTTSVMGDSYLLDGTRMEPPSSYKLCPNFTISDPRATILAYKEKNAFDQPVFAYRHIGSSLQYYAATGFISTSAWRNIFTKSGVHCYEPSGQCVIWASHGFISINGAPGDYTLTLPATRTATQLLPTDAPSLAPAKQIHVKLTDTCKMRLFKLD